jgi:hypothetical protein
VDGGDFDVWFTHLLSNTFDITQGDINADGNVDGGDFDIWFTHLLSVLPTAPSLGGVAVTPVATVDSGAVTSGTVTGSSGVTSTGTDDGGVMSKIKDKIKKNPRIELHLPSVLRGGISK